MQYFDKNKFRDENKFVNYGLALFDDFLKTKPPVIEESAIKEREYFERGLRNFYRSDPANKLLYSEYSIYKTNICGVNFRGTFDRLEVDKSGRYILVDYKTGSTNKHVSNDVLSCMQGLIYAAMIEYEKKLGNIKIYKCEFRYPFIDDSSYILYDENTRQQLMDKIQDFIYAIENHDFGFDPKKQIYVDKYEHLISLMKELRRQDD